ncbi:MAG: hypothetical protein ACXU86_15770 [Archangium sp.]
MTEFKWFEEKIPKLTLILTSLTLVYVTLESRGILQTILAETRHQLLEKIQSMRLHLNPTMDKIFGDHIESTLKILNDALVGKVIHCADLDEFRRFYKRTLEVFPRAHLCATSLPYRKYFWSGEPDKSKFESSMQEFIQGGGKMSRIFFVSREEYESDSEVRQIIHSHLAMGVETYVSDPARLPSGLIRYFVVDDERRIAWEATVHDRAITHTQFTMDPETTHSFHETFKRIIEHEHTRRLQRQDMIV